MTIGLILCPLGSYSLMEIKIWSHLPLSIAGLSTPYKQIIPFELKNIKFNLVSKNICEKDFHITPYIIMHSKKSFLTIPHTQAEYKKRTGVRILGPGQLAPQTISPRLLAPDLYTI